MENFLFWSLEEWFKFEWDGVVEFRWRYSLYLKHKLRRIERLKN